VRIFSQAKLTDIDVSPAPALFATASAAYAAAVETATEESSKDDDYDTLHALIVGGECCGDCADNTVKLIGKTDFSNLDRRKLYPNAKSNPVTRSSPRQRQAKRPTLDNPTGSVLSPIEKRRLHVEESSEVVIAVTERKVCRPEDLLISNGFKKSEYYTDQPCLVLNCKDPACVFGQTCKCKAHKNCELFFGVNAFLTSRAVCAHHPACTSQNLTESKKTEEG
jgi:hypothetical protein